ncbi:hypothetical protein JTB14_033469 [Gonioctena quinquepunctata]|nr:hypothetical protein JTB14_033469 [Gonioctena quinquepunctata]
MKNSISELARARNDDWGQAIVERLEQVTDLVAADAQYHNSCMKKLYQTSSTEERKKRGPYASEIDTAMQYIYSYLEENSDECQFSLDELMTKIEDDIEEEETDTILEQINDEIENEEDHDETDDPIVDDTEETSVFDISIGIEDDENPTPGPSTRMKRRKLN